MHLSSPMSLSKFLLATYMLYALRKTPGVDLSVLRFVALHPFVFRGLRILKLLYGSKLSKSWVTLTEMRTVLVSLVESVNMYLSLFALLLILCFIQVVITKQRVLCLAYLLDFCSHN